MTQQELFEKLSKIIAEFIDVEPSAVNGWKNLVEDFGCDSLDRIEIIMAVEEEFKIEIDDSECEKIYKVDDLYHSVAKRVGVE